MRLIDAEELKKKAYPFPCAIGVEYAVTLRAINEAHTIDVVPMDVHKKCMEAEIEKRILTEKTNRQILENYVPVVHAKWIMDDLGNHHCSKCSERLPFIHCYSEETYEEWDEEIDESLYCPHCGAKMDEKEDAHDS